MNEPVFTTMSDFEGLYQTVAGADSILNSLPIALNAHPIGWMKAITGSTVPAATSNVWLAAKS